MLLKVHVHPSKKERGGCGGGGAGGGRLSLPQCQEFLGGSKCSDWCMPRQCRQGRNERFGCLLLVVFSTAAFFFWPMCPLFLCVPIPGMVRQCGLGTRGIGSLNPARSAAMRLHLHSHLQTGRERAKQASTHSPACVQGEGPAWDGDCPFLPQWRNTQRRKRLRKHVRTSQVPQYVPLGAVQSFSAAIICAILSAPLDMLSSPDPRIMICISFVSSCEPMACTARSSCSLADVVARPFRRGGMGV